MPNCSDNNNGNGWNLMTYQIRLVEQAQQHVFQIVDTTSDNQVVCEHNLDTEGKVGLTVTNSILHIKPALAANNAKKRLQNTHIRIAQIHFFNNNNVPSKYIFIGSIDDRIARLNSQIVLISDCQMDIGKENSTIYLYLTKYEDGMLDKNYLELESRGSLFSPSSTLKI